MTKFSFFLFVFILLLNSCENSDGSMRTSKYLPGSMGGFDQLMIIVDDNARKTELGDTLKKYFNVGYEILYRYEPLMDISYMDVSNFKNFIQRSRNIIFIGTVDGNDPTSVYIKTALGAEKVAKLRNQPTKPYQFRREIWARNQLVGFVLAKDDEALYEAIAKYSQNWLQAFMDSDLPEYREFTYISGVNGSLKKQLTDYYKFEIDIPLDYKLAKNEDGFIWLRRDDPDMVYNFMIEVKEITDSKKKFTNRGILRRNKLGIAHVSSDSPGSYMSTDSTLGFIQKYSIVDDNPRFENRGLWRMENDFKGGPFLNYYIHDKKNNQIIFLEGFVYGPTKDKKMAMRQIETILSTFKIL